MQEGWRRRREMEAEIGRRALARARRLEESPGAVTQCESEAERVAFALRLAESTDEEALRALEDLATESDVVEFAVREALRDR
jgi:hypothetical protein